MSKADETLGLILESAQKEFLRKGYEKASLRIIAKNAGVTTGALYARFSNKNALFSALVSPITEHLMNMYREGNEQGVAHLEEGNPQEMWTVSETVADDLVDYIFANKPIFNLLINCSVGSSFEHFIDELDAEEEKQCVEYLDKLRKKGYPCADITKQELHMLISAQSYAFYEIVRHDIPKEESLKQLKTLTDFFRLGWKNIFGE